MTIGTVKWFNNAKGYGFICPSDNENEDVFAHFSAIVMEGYKSLKAGQRVSSDVQQGPKGLHAIDITPTEEQDSPVEESNLVAEAANS